MRWALTTRQAAVAGSDSREKPANGGHQSASDDTCEFCQQGLQTSCLHGGWWAGGPAPVRAYMRELMPDVLEGRIEPGLVFDRTTNIDGVPDGYRAMNDREAIKVMIEF